MSDFYDYFGRMVGHSSRVEAPAWTAWMLRPINKMLNLGLPVAEERLRFFAMESSYPGDKAKALLGYEPRVPIEEGMRRTESWLRKEGHLTEA
jgi:2-alkyl-3-oxoalkanoate reductase